MNRSELMELALQLQKIIRFGGYKYYYKETNDIADYLKVLMSDFENKISALEHQIDLLIKEKEIE